MPLAGSRRGTVALLIGIFLLALGLRLWGIDFGLPYSQIPDETADIATSFQLARGQVPRYAFHRVAGSLLQLPIHAAHFAALKLADRDFSIADFEAHYYTNRSAFLLTVRITMAVAGAVSIFLLYLIGHAITDRREGGLFAALLMAVYPLPAYLAHTGLPDTLALLSVAGCLYAALRIARDGSLRWYIIGGCAVALSLLLRLQTAPVGGALMIAHLVYGLRQPSNRVRILAFRWLWLVIGGLIGLAVFNPVLWLNPAAALFDFQFIISERFAGTYQNDPHALTSLSNYFYNIQTNITLPLIMIRPVILVSACVGLAFGIIRRDARILIILVLAAFAGPILVVPGPRLTYWLALAVPCAALSAYGLVSLAALRRGRWLAGAAAVVIVGWSAIEIIKIDLLLSQPTTQELAYDYITAQIPAGTSLLEGDPFVYSVPLSRTTTSMERMSMLENLPPSYQFFLEHPDQIRQPAYDVYGSEYRTEITSDAAMTAFLKTSAVVYVIEVDWCYGEISYANLSDLTFPLVTPAVQNALILETTFSPFDTDSCVQRIENRTHMEYMRLWDWVRPGPIIRIYRVRS